MDELAKAVATDVSAFICNQIKATYDNAPMNGSISVETNGNAKNGTTELTWTVKIQINIE